MPSYVRIVLIHFGAIVSWSSSGAASFIEVGRGGVITSAAFNASATTFRSSIRFLPTVANIPLWLPPKVIPGLDVTVRPASLKTLSRSDAKSETSGFPVITKRLICHFFMRSSRPFIIDSCSLEMRRGANFASSANRDVRSSSVFFVASAAAFNAFAALVSFGYIPLRFCGTLTGLSRCLSCLSRFMVESSNDLFLV